MVSGPDETQIESEPETQDTGTNGRNQAQKNDRVRDERKKIFFWNVAGIGDKDEDWKYVQKFDIVNLTETWAELKNWKKTEKWQKNLDGKCRVHTRTRERAKMQEGC